MAARKSNPRKFPSCAAGIVSLTLALAACSIQLVPPYDEVIANELYDFNKAFLQFMAGVSEKVPSASASYAQNTDFYNTWQATLATLVQRAEADDPDGRCPGTKLTARAMQSIGSIVLRKGVKTDDDPTTRTGSCTTILVKNIEQELTETACFHQAIYGQASADCTAIGFSKTDVQSLGNVTTETKRALLSEVQDAVTASVTAAMTLELAKKHGTD